MLRHEYKKMPGTGCDVRYVIFHLLLSCLNKHLRFLVFNLNVLNDIFQS